MTPDWESRNNSDFPEWKLTPQLFQKMWQLRGTPEIDLFASKLSHHINIYFSWRSDPLNQAANALQQNWFHESLYAFSPFCMIPMVLSNILKEKVTEAMMLSIEQPILLTWRRGLLKNLLVQIVELLSQLFQNEFQYRTINNYRSPVSPFHDHIQGKPVGEEPRICSLVVGVFNSRLSQPRYCFIWNFQTLIDFVKSEW